MSQNLHNGYLLVSINPHGLIEFFFEFFYIFYLSDSLKTKPNYRTGETCCYFVSNNIIRQNLKQCLKFRIEFINFEKIWKHGQLPRSGNRAPRGVKCNLYFPKGPVMNKGDNVFDTISRPCGGILRQWQSWSSCQCADTKYRKSRERTCDCYV